MAEHVNYPHEPGRLYDCPACEERCHCEPDVGVGTTPCIYHASDGKGAYHPSPQVLIVMGLILTDREQQPRDPSDYRRGVRDGLHVVMRVLVESESGIEDPDWLDETCAELLQDALISMSN